MLMIRRIIGLTVDRIRAVFPTICKYEILNQLGESLFTHLDTDWPVRMAVSGPIPGRFIRSDEKSEGNLGA